MKKTLTTCLLTLVMTAPAVSWACSEPAKPGEFPDPATAVTAQMVKANNEVKAYVKAMQEYLGCSGMSRSQQKAAIKELEDYAESFNKLIREFKAR
ncbi:hypothetical protein KO507_10905 [Gilvimarinus agarilyticus]|uniref:hypothetical protein n=1 Tax=unclassified Gilvimarinus TaxID=2642066 RepID=UPI001C09059B|nr:MULTISPECIES: hypothetical protein [unclassified Gilvimarinus]MBU2886272.1 hypothetical protein [Gilvimarinus agarilyticus]MDO6570960.1 hypothetical protein [Gilvimarinus sp. 2_MG-2023]MDO6747753.1 hypothetical protein [Gilvimarinus sp. 1_MG-2023]